MFRLADLREMLRYVPQYRDRIFVIAKQRGTATLHALTSSGADLVPYRIDVR